MNSNFKYRTDFLSNAPLYKSQKKSKVKQIFKVSQHKGQGSCLVILKEIILSLGECFKHRKMAPKDKEVFHSPYLTRKVNKNKVAISK